MNTGMEVAKAAATIRAAITYAEGIGARDPGVVQLPCALRSLRGSCDELLAIMEPADRPST